jgi:DNA-binding Xre family transcriptional regulator
MKLTSDEKRVFLADVQRHMQERNWSPSELARKTGVHQSQVSRILAGNFKTFNSSVMTICMHLGMQPNVYLEQSRLDEDERHIANSAIAIWNGTHQDAGLVVSLLREIAKLRKPERRR